ncbi:MAG TPA: HAMP domain-containing sensor histidine kinase, partial [Myxococcaceae bacterium]|nr:HAMP domain-containing sensor histidine kinase [Myxococcaceae bacterium]
SHELKTPLTSRKLQHDLIRRSLSLECQDSIGPRLDAALRQVDRLSTLMNSLLDVSRISSGHLRLEPIDMELTQLAREVLERLSEMFSQAACAVGFSGPEPVRGRWDAMRLDQVLVNLLSNAAKYGTGRPVFVSVESRGARAFLSVRDDGIGIAPKDVPRLFNRFERAVSERHYGGLGLGLYISKQIVEAMGGDIHVKSEPGRGSTFTVELPLNSVDAPGR